MSLLDNQSYKKKISFVKSDDRDKTVTFTINIQCNHDIDKTILAEIETTINDMFLQNYENAEDKKLEEKLEKENTKRELELQKLNAKHEFELQKQNAKIQKNNKLLQLEYEKQRIQQLAEQAQQQQLLPKNPVSAKKPAVKKRF